MSWNDKLSQHFVTNSRVYIIATLVAVIYTVFIALTLSAASSSFKYLPDLEWYFKLPFGFLAAWIVSYVLLRVYHLFSAEEQKTLAVVCAGGAIGGFFIKFAVLLLEETARPAIPLDHLLCALLGALTAGFTIFTLSENVNEQKPRLLFLSIAAGLAFPSVVLTLLEFEPQNLADAETKLQRAAELQVEKAGQSSKETKAELNKLEGEVGASVKQITYAPNLPAQEKERQLERLAPIVEQTFGADSAPAKLIQEGKQVVAPQTLRIDPEAASRLGRPLPMTTPIPTPTPTPTP